MSDVIYTQPIQYRKEFFVIDDGIITNRYITIIDSTQDPTIRLVINDTNSFIYSIDYILVVVDSLNYTRYPYNDIGDHIISWEHSLIYNDNIYNSTVLNIGLGIEVNYIHIDWVPVDEDITEINDYVDWEID
jgi:hypothetical protein